jgi:hypothetical protein
MARGAPTPTWLEEAPDAWSGDSFYMKAFWDLSTERAIGFTIGPIPWQAIRLYASANGLPQYMMRLFESVIRAMDEVYMQHAEETRKKSQSKANKRENISAND